METSPATRLPTRSKLGTILRLAGLALCLALLAFQLDPAVLLAAGEQVDRASLGVACVAWIVGMLLRSGKWMVQVRALGLDFQPAALVRAQLWGVLAGVVTPLRLGEAYRLSGISLRNVDDAALPAAAIFYEKMVEAHVLFCIVVVGVFTYFDQPGVAAALAGVALFGAWVAYGEVSLPQAVLRRVRPLALLQASRDALSGRGRAAVLGLTILSHAANFVGGGSMYRALGDIGWGALCFGLPTITFSSAVPFTVSGIGVRELVAIEVFRGTGLSPEAITLAATSSFLGANVLPTLVLLPVVIAGSWIFQAPAGR